MKSINGYQLTSELKPDKSGYAKWGFGNKNGREYFIKEFLSPIYPMDTSVLSPAQVKSKRDICSKFDMDKRMFYGELNKCLNGNVVTVSDFFRYESRFYMVTEKINAVNLTPNQVSRFNLAQKILICKVILHSVAMLHKRGIVHADIKADNVLFKQTPLGVYTAKLIDFDSSFFERKPPSADGDFQGDMVYFAPESFIYIAEESGSPTCKIDIFALGVLFHQYFCGELPGFDKEKYAYAFESILDGSGVSVHPSLPKFVADVLKKMLSKNPEDRPDAESCFNYFQYYCANPRAKIEDIDSSVAERMDSKEKGTIFVVERAPENTMKSFEALDGDFSPDDPSVGSSPGIRNVSVHISESGLKSTMKKSVEPSRSGGASYVPPAATPGSKTTEANTPPAGSIGSKSEHFKKADDLL